MERFTEKYNEKYKSYLRDCFEYDITEANIVNKLGRLEDLEEELGCPIEVLFKALKKGFYYENANGEIHFMNYAILVNDIMVETKPCYAVKETTLESCYYGDVSNLKEVKDAHYWDWKTCMSWKAKDYQKTWWLKRDKSEWYESN